MRLLCHSPPGGVGGKGKAGQGQEMNPVLGSKRNFPFSGEGDLLFLLLKTPTESMGSRSFS